MMTPTEKKIFPKLKDPDPPIHRSASPLASTPPLSDTACEFDTHFKVFHELMSNKVLEILLVASAYDAFILEEDGSLASKIINEYRGLNLSRPPRLTRVPSAAEALALLRNETFDLVISMPNPDDMDSFELGLAVKQVRPSLPVILLAHTIEGLYPVPADRDASGIDQIFIWSGDADLLLAIVKSVEDRLNVDKDTQRAQVRVIILVEDSPLYRSYFLPLMYKEVVHQTQAVLAESLNEEHRLLKMRARPKVLVAGTFEEARHLYERYRAFIFGIVSDTRFPRNGRLCADAGFQFLHQIKAEIPDLPMLLLSSESENRAKAKQIPALFIDKSATNLFAELHDFFLNHLGFGDFVFRTPDGAEVARAGNLRQLEAILPHLPEEPLRYHASRNRFSNWIMARSEIALASRLRQLKISDFPDVEALRRFLIGSIHSLRKWRQKGVVLQFNAKNFDPSVIDFVKIGQGSLGGKARGLAFVANLLRQSSRLLETFKQIEICIPPTMVITTAVFDTFVSANRLDELPIAQMDDDQITAAFLDARMPAEIVDDLKAYLDMVRYPLSVRSSSLLEDARHQPLTDLYMTMMIANNQADDRLRLRCLIDAIKRVYASTWFQLPRRFAHSTAYRHRMEQMAVIIQQIVGKTYNGYFYPAISGVARSQNFYAIGSGKTDDGMAKIALGFGCVINDGEAGLRFCPKYPKILPDFSKVEDIMTNAQRHFYALELSGDGRQCDDIHAADLVRRHINDALEEAPVRQLVSTYVAQDGRLRDSATVAGTKLVTFASILKYNQLPLPALLEALLDVSRQGMGCQVEFEFAVNLSDRSDQLPRFHLLQMRPMATGSPFEAVLSHEDRQRAVCLSHQALGHGQFNTMADIVYIIPEKFDPAHTRDMAAQIRAFNAVLKAEERPYLLIGPGRWGSFDPWLGIPVRWEDINGAKAIIELRNAAINAEPSQGSHFFQNITTHGLPYLTISDDSGGPDRMRWEAIYALETIRESHYVRHVRCPVPLQVKCDGRTSQGVVLL
jgi:Pyruvate phosphate dikinase, AMP/ATP-binding domain